MRIICTIILVCCLVLMLQACGTRYSAKPITGFVVDAESKKPIEGVVVVANWELEGGLEGGNLVGSMMIMESVTDTNGRYHFPAWGPISAPKGTPYGARLKGMDPQLVLFKSGYKPIYLESGQLRPTDLSNDPPVRSSPWDGKTVELRRFEGSSLADYANALWPLNSALDPLAARCQWEHIPRMIMALHNQKEEFLKANVHVVIFIDYMISNEDVLARDGCRSFKQFVKEYAQ